MSNTHWPFSFYVKPQIPQIQHGFHPLISHSGGSDCVMLWSPEGEDDQGISKLIWCGRTNPLAAN